MSAVPVDTAHEVWEQQVQSWRGMTPPERAALADRLSIDIIEFARAGIAAQLPDADERKGHHELARRRFGSELADAAFGGTGDR